MRRAARGRADRARHRAIVAATHNPLYVRLYSGMLDLFATHMRDDEGQDAAAAHRHHRELVEAIAARDSVRATEQVAAIFAPFMA